MPDLDDINTEAGIDESNGLTADDSLYNEAEISKDEKDNPENTESYNAKDITEQGEESQIPRHLLKCYLLAPDFPLLSLCLI